MFQTPFFWEAIPFAGGPGRFLGLLDYWAGDPMDLCDLCKFSQTIPEEVLLVNTGNSGAGLGSAEGAGNSTEPTKNRGGFFLALPISEDNLY
jgi:hypothetical protein